MSKNYDEITKEALDIAKEAFETAKELYEGLIEFGIDIDDDTKSKYERLSKLYQPTVSASNSCGHEWEITTGRCVKCGKSKYY